MSNLHARILLVGGPGPELRVAAGIARDMGAAVRLAEGTADAMAALRSAGADLVMIDVEGDVAGFMVAVRAERMAVPVLGCGVNASPTRAVAAIRAGAYDYLPLPPQRDLIAAALLSIGERSAEIVGAHPSFTVPRDRALAFARSTLPLTITGPPGCGKTLLARAVHSASGVSGSFVIAHCAGVAPDILESELFGHAAGAFPGATEARAGKWAEAAGGTLVLAGLEALPGALQARLLVALEARSTRLIATARVATADLFAAGRLRADLHWQLSVTQVALPSIAEREGDLEQLMGGIAARLAALNSLARPGFTPEALAACRGYAWPDNIRELEDVLHRALLLADGRRFDAGHLLRGDGQPLLMVAAETPASDMASLVGSRVEDVERDLILSTLSCCGGNRTSASSILGISIRTMRNKLKSFSEAGFAVAPAH